MVARSLKLLAVAELVGRLHSTATNLATGLAVQAWTSSYAVAGLVIAALAIGNGLAAPLRGRFVDRSPVITLVLCGTMHATALLFLACVTSILDRTAWPVAMLMAFLAGTSFPPVAPAFRAAIPDLARDEGQALQVLTWEATYQELIFVIGPPSVMAVLAVSGTSTALGLVAALAVLGAIVFALTLRWTYGRADRGATMPFRPSRSGHKNSTPLDVTGRHVLVRLSFVYGFVLSTLTAMTLVGVSVSVERGHPAAAGWLEAAVAVGSMAGGALVSRGLLRRWTLGARLAGMCLSAGLLVVVTALAAPLPSIAAALALTGGWIAPSLAVHGAHVLAVSGPGRRAEAFGWVSAAGMATNSLATPGVGVALDSAGAPGGAGLAMAAALLGCALSAGLGAVSPPPGHDPSV